MAKAKRRFTYKLTPTIVDNVTVITPMIAEMMGLDGHSIAKDANCRRRTQAHADRVVASINDKLANREDGEQYNLMIYAGKGGTTVVRLISNYAHVILNTGNYMKLTNVNNNGYISFDNTSLHKAVAVAFHLLPDMNYRVGDDEIDHLDGNKHNNRLDNLQVVSHQENTRRRSNNPNNKSIRAVAQYTLTGKFVAHYKSMVDAAEATGNKSSNICASIKTRKHKTCGGFYWDYYNGDNSDITFASDYFARKYTVHTEKYLETHPNTNRIKLKPGRKGHKVYSYDSNMNLEEVYESNTACAIKLGVQAVTSRETIKTNENRDGSKDKPYRKTKGHILLNKPLDTSEE